jgi:signal transduction histidine kinase
VRFACHFALFLALPMIWLATAQATALAIDVRDERIDLSDHLALLHDPDGKLNFIEAAAKRTDFRQVKPGDLAQSFNAGVFWLHFSLIHSGELALTRWLVVGTPKVDLITLYSPAAGNAGGWQQMQAGRSVPLSQKPVVATDAVFPVTLKAGEHREFLVRIDVRGAIDMRMVLWEPQRYRLEAGERTFLLAAVLGGLLLGSLLALMIFGYLREGRYLWLAVFLLAISGIEAMRENLVGIYLWPENLLLPPQMLSGVAALAVFSLAKVVQGALDLPQRLPQGDRAMTALRWIAVLGLAYSLIDYGAGVRIVSIVAALMLPASALLSILAWRQNHPSAAVFTLAFSFALLTETARQLANLGILPWVSAMNFSMAAFLLATPFIVLGMLDQTRKLANQLALAEQLRMAKSAFLAEISHELRSPLNTILGFSRMLQRGSARLTLQEGTAGIEKSTLRLLTLIGELLDESRAAAGKLDISPTPTLLAPWLDELCADMTLLAESRGNRFACVRPAALPEALVMDGARLRQVLDNLLSNANRHTHRGEIGLDIAVTLEGEFAMLSFTVRDNGEGMTPEQLGVIFEPFVRGSSDHEGSGDSASGFGLGMSISRSLVHQMGGDITVSSTAGQGSCFSFSVRCPLAAVPAVASVAGSAPCVSPVSAQPRILVIEDDPLQREMLRDQLAAAGFALQAAANGMVALPALREQAWDVVLTDQMMPDGDGWFVLQQVRHATANAVPVVLLSAVGPRRPVDFPQALDFDAVLQKPVTQEVLVATLWRVMLKVGVPRGFGGTAITPAQWQALADLARDGEVSGMEEWIAQQSASPAVEWVRAVLHRLDLDLLQRVARRMAG